MNTATTEQTTDARPCLLCGHDLPPSKGRGRPREFHDECRRLYNLLGWAEDILVARKFTPEKASMMRRRLWTAGNLVKTAGQGHRKDRKKGEKK